MVLIYYILSKIYLSVVCVWQLFYRWGIFSSCKFTTPILSIGNITVGGTGKTPMIIYLSKLLTKYNISHAIVSRGYKKQKSGMIVLNKETIKNIFPFECGDEPYMMAKKLGQIPIVVDKNKKRAIQYIINEINPQLILLDDGFQSLKIHRSLDVVLINSIATKQDVRLLPWGNLREPLKNISRANLIIYSKQNLSQSAVRPFPIKKYIVSSLSNIVPYMESSVSAKVLLYNINTMELELFTSYKKNNLALGFCGIGDPASFVKTSSNFFKLEKLILFPDHHKYSAKDFIDLLQRCGEQKIGSIVTTYKDFVKIQSLCNNINKLNIQLFVIDIDIQVTKEGLLMNKIKNLLFAGKG